MQRKIILGTVLLIIIAVSAYLLHSRGEPGVAAVAVQQGDIRETLEETGYIQAAEEFAVQALESGRIVEIHTPRGEAVQAGQVLFTLQNLELDSQFAALDERIAATRTEMEALTLEYQTTELSWQKARDDLQRQEELLAAGAISQSDYEIALNKADILEASLNSQQDMAQSIQNQLLSLGSQREELAKKAQRLSITSPLDGVLQVVNVKAGQLVSQGESLAQIAAADDLEVRVDVLSEDMGQVALGQAVEVRNASLSQPLTGKITEIYPAAHEELSSLGVVQRRVTVIAALDESAWLQPGYEVTVNIITAAKTSVLLLPREAVLITGPSTGEVNRIMAGKVVKQQVELGLKNQAEVEVASGLQLQDLVIQDASLHWEEGSRVKAVTNND
ncbi:MAG: efflux RND transporter periplasmic adaptor subunit [Syntrophomonadaceae bacterium]|nr:efflux RND transporter periplasmic adaptor subunit [Syntrophomonadaceae bacterium]